MTKRISCILLIPLLIIGCTKKNAHFYQNHSSSVTISAEPSSATFFMDNSGQINTITKNQCETFNTKMNKIQSVYLKQLKLTITDTTGETFSFGKSFKLYINSTGQNELLAASIDSISDTIGTVLYLKPGGSDLKDFLKADNFSWRLKTENDESIPEDVHITVYSSFQINAKQNRINKKK